MISVLRGQRVMMDRDLAELYGVGTKVLNQAVRRHRDRFPKDFMFQLTVEETENWKSQIVTSNPAVLMGLRKRPLAFTEQGVAMLSSVLNSERAVRVNIAIMRVFVRLRHALVADTGLSARMKNAESAIAEHDRELTEHAVHINEALGKIRRLSKS